MPSVLLLVATAFVGLPADTFAQTVKAAAGRCLAFEIYLPGDAEGDKSPLREAMEQFAKDQPGIGLRVMNVTDEAAKTRLASLAKHFKVEPQPPVVYGCGKLIAAGDDVGKCLQEIKAAATMTVFVRTGCPHCAKAKAYLPQFQAAYPGVTVVQRDIAAEAAAATELQAVYTRHHVGGGTVPTFYACNEVIVGFDDGGGTSKRVETLWKKWSHECGVYKTDPKPPAAPQKSSMIPWFVPQGALFGLLMQADSPPPPLPLPDESEAAPPPLPLPGESAAEDPLPLPTPEGESSAASPPTPNDIINVPWLGEVRASQFGLPVFTIVIGLIDGFNPCAMWVLLFLLSLLVNLHDRLKILAVAGTFVFISGAAYFAFMAMWLNVVQWIGYLRIVQVILALTAIVIGAVHIKDFFAFKKGLTFSIPESMKPSIYERSRKIVMAEKLIGAIAGAIVLAVMVNFIELLCTAGLPAMYTAILSQQHLPAWAYYGYLLLYNVAYMFDDSVMVAIVVTTLGRRKLQETEGRWLKLVSGAVILCIGLVMLIKPELLV